MSYALLPLAIVLGYIAFVIFVIIFYGVTLKVIGRIRRWRQS